MLRWFHTTAPLRHTVSITIGAVVIPLIGTWAVAVAEYSRVAGAARTEVASNYLQVLRLGMEMTLGVSTAGMLLGLVLALWLGKGIARPIAMAVETLERIAAGDLSEADLQATGANEAARIVAAAAALRRAAIISRLAAEDHARASAEAAAERHRVMAALAEGLGALAANNRRLRGVESPPLQATRAPAPSPAAQSERAPVLRREPDPADDRLVDLLLRLGQHRAPPPTALALAY